MRFDQLVRDGMTMREVRTRYPETGEVFARYGFRDSCSDCSLHTLARKHGLQPAVLVDALNCAVTGNWGEPSSPSAPLA